MTSLVVTPVFVFIGLVCLCISLFYVMELFMLCRSRDILQWCSDTSA